MKKFFLDLLFPIHCLGCAQEEYFICPSCFEKISLNKKQPLRFNHKNNLNGLIITNHYDHPLVKKAIHCYKYDFVKDLAKPLGQLMAKKLTNFSNIFNENNSVLIPVPLHKKRLKWRGFNQSLLLTEVISQQLKMPINNDILIRRKHTLPQAKIKDPKEKKRNIKEAFSINPNFEKSSIIQNKNIILIDDISTTGATLEEAAQTLKPLQPKQIWGLVIAHG
jgi:ComF family protein